MPNAKKILKFYYIFMGLSFAYSYFIKNLTDIQSSSFPSSSYFSIIFLIYCFFFFYQIFFREDSLWGFKRRSAEIRNLIREKSRLGFFSRAIIIFFTLITGFLAILDPSKNQSAFFQYSTIIDLIYVALTFFVLYYPPTRKIIDKPKIKK